MRPLKFNIKMYFLAGILGVIGAIILCTAFTIFSMHINFDKGEPFIPDNNQEQEEPDDNHETPIPTLTVPQSLSVDILDSSSEYQYQTTNLGEYTITVSVQDESVLTLDGNIIKPKSLGSTKIIVSINTSPTISKETVVTIVDCVKQVNFTLTDSTHNPVSIFYTNTEYILHVEQNILSNITPNIYYNNVCNFELIDIVSTTYFFKFKVINSGSFSFKYVDKYVELEKEYLAYRLPTTFDVIFSNGKATSDTISLYLFNMDYSTEANADGKYNTSMYEIISESGTVDNIILNNTFDNNIISVSNNIITALKEGSTSLTFTSTVSGISQTFTIRVTNIYANSIIVNDTSISMGTSHTVSLGTSETYAFSCTITPKYALGSIIIDYDPNLIGYTNNYISLLSKSPSSIKVLYNNELWYELTLSPKPSVVHSVSIISSTKASELSELELRVLSDSYVQLLILALDSSTNEPLENQDFSLVIQDQTICKWLDDKIINGKISLQILSAGETTIFITDSNNGITIEIILIVN